ncbi:MAG: hypothetical protein D6769_02815 [Methanobacteriota archaeon]|nr:MAG: hypothetical protein D6769_02815 [Euryarchaeota archaeon]
MYELSSQFKISKTGDAIKMLETISRRRKKLDKKEALLVDKAVRKIRLDLLSRGKEKEFLKVSEIFGKVRQKM